MRVEGEDEVVRMLQWLCALKSPADAAENAGTVDRSTADP